jgi:serine/threonine-protein kinase
MTSEALPPPTTILPAGTRIGPYEVLGFLARGGMGVVYLAQHFSLKEKIALKVLYPHLTGEGEFATRFQREGAAMARLRHPNIAQVLNADIANGYHFLAMEYAAEGTLRSQMDRQKLLPVEEVLAITRQMALALQHAHVNGVIHRDIKPSNILCAGAGRYLLTDFGVAQVASDPRITKNLATMGTPEYMSPEQGNGLAVDGRSDLYSLGVVMYEMLAGRPPFSAPNHLATLLQHARDSVPPIQKQRPDTPPAVRAIVNKALAKNPKDRFKSAAEMVTAIDASMLGTTRKRTPAWVMAALAGVVLMCLSLPGVLILSQMSAASQAAAPAAKSAELALATTAPMRPTATLVPLPTPAKTATSISASATFSALLSPYLKPTTTPNVTLVVTPSPAPTNTSAAPTPSPTPKPTQAGPIPMPVARIPASVTLALNGASAERRYRSPQWDEGNPAICSYLDEPGDSGRELIWRFVVSVKLKNTSNQAVNLSPVVWALKAQNGYVLRGCFSSASIPARGEANVAVFTFFEKDKLVPYRLELIGTRQAVCFVPVGNYSDLSQPSLAFAPQKCN